MARRIRFEENTDAAHINMSALVEKLLDARKLARLGQCELQEHTRLGRVQVAAGHEAQSIVVNLVIAQHHRRHHT
jgi:hypothetical protein